MSKSRETKNKRENSNRIRKQRGSKMTFFGGKLIQFKVFVYERQHRQKKAKGNKPYMRGVTTETEDEGEEEKLHKRDRRQRMVA